MQGEDATLPRVLLFTEKKETSVLYKKLSLDLHRAAVVGEAPSSDKVVTQKFGVTSFPALFVSPPGPFDPKAESYQWTRYDGALVCQQALCLRLMMNDNDDDE